LFCLADISTVVVFLSLPASLPGLTLRHSSDLAISSFNGGRLCSVVVLRSSSIPPASVAGVEDRFPRSRWVQGSLWLGGVALLLSCSVWWMWRVINY
ncbi:unnamed protein product, partial [Brassica oleracea]